MAATTQHCCNEALHSSRSARRLATPGTALALAALLLAACSKQAESNAPHLAQLRLTPDQLETTPVDQSQSGSAKSTGIVTRLITGNPSEGGFYSELLFVPPNMEIKAHSHRDDRVGSVLSGTWYFAYGEQYAAGELAELKPGSVYTEPGGQAHFARTGSEPVVLQLTGNGPTDTHYVNPADDPKAKLAASK